MFIIHGTVNSKQKYNRGRIFPEHCVFGEIYRENNKVFLVPLTRDKTIPQIFIKQYSMPGTNIFSDMWGVYTGNEDLEGFSLMHLLWITLRISWTEKQAHILIRSSPHWMSWNEEVNFTVELREAWSTHIMRNYYGDSDTPEINISLKSCNAW